MRVVYRLGGTWNMPSPRCQRPIAGLLLVVTSSVGDEGKRLLTDMIVLGHFVARGE